MLYLLMMWRNPRTWGHRIILRTPEATAVEVRPLMGGTAEDL